MALPLLQSPPRPPSLSYSHSAAFGTRLIPPQQLLPILDQKKRDPKNLSTCRASWQELVGVLVFSAVPFTAVKAVANSSLGEALRRRLEKTKSAAAARSLESRNLARKAREESFWYGKERPRWLGPIPYKYPTYLTGEFPGDYGFDIASLGKDAEAFKKYFNFEILHARWAMLAALGVIIPELLDQLGAVHFVEPVWWRVGYAKLQGDTLDYLGIPGLHIAGSQGILVIAICQFFLMVGPEYARYCGIEALEPLGIYLPGDINYPGGFLFDPLGFSKDPTVFEELKVKEIKNGRLAMVAWLGFYLQAAVTAILSAITSGGVLSKVINHIMNGPLAGGNKGEKSRAARGPEQRSPSSLFLAEVPSRTNMSLDMSLLPIPATNVTETCMCVAMCHLLMTHWLSGQSSLTKRDTSHAAAATTTIPPLFKEIGWLG